MLELPPRRKIGITFALKLSKACGAIEATEAIEFGTERPREGSCQGGFTKYRYVGLTALTLVLAYSGHGLRRRSGGVIIAAYALFVILVLATS